MGSSSPIRHWGILLLLVLTAIFGTHFFLEDLVGQLFSLLTSSVESGLAVSLLAISGLSLDVILPVPSSVLSIWSAVNLGFVQGLVVVWMGMCLSCLLGYWIGNSPGSWLIERFFSPQDLQKAHALSGQYGFGALVLLRAVPVLAEASVVVAGLTRFSFGKFLVATSLANLGVALVYALVGTYASFNASFILAFSASIGVPLLAMAVYKLLATTEIEAKTTAVTRIKGLQRSKTEIVTPTFNIEYSYPLYFTSDVFGVDNTALVEQFGGKKSDTEISLLFFVDRGVINGHSSLAEQIARYCDRHGLNYHGDIIVVPGGDEVKSQGYVDEMQQKMLSAQLDRQSYVVAIGGGAVLDAVGYAAATFHRGIRLVRMPTTVLAQNDAGVGVKNGINAQGIKNLFGCFAVPHAIINDSHFLTSLSQRDFRAGFAEAIKVALIRDRKFYFWLRENREVLNRRDEQAVHYSIQRCAELHLNQICNGGDAFERGSARPLDYGHWSAHKLESLTGHELSHGEAVAIGMSLDAMYSVETGLLDRAEAEDIIEVISDFGFSVWHPALQLQNENGESALLAGLEEFRQHLGGDLCITLLCGIGDAVEVNQIDCAALLRARDKLAGFDRDR